MQQNNLAKKEVNVHLKLGVSCKGSPSFSSAKSNKKQHIIGQEKSTLKLTNECVLFKMAILHDTTRIIRVRYSTKSCYISH